MRHPKYTLLTILVIVLATVPFGSADSAEFSIDADFAGGNILVNRVEGNHVYVQPDLRDTEGWWFYWNFRVRGAGGKSLTFHFEGNNPIGTRGPAVSLDGGLKWQWLDAAGVKENRFLYSFAEDANNVRFCFSLPYLQSDLDRFLAKHSKDKRLVVDKLCSSRKRRGVERIRVLPEDNAPVHRVLLTARNHACESVASYSLEGFLEAALGDTPSGNWYRENAEIMAIPFMDKDGVEDGDQGKNRKPHDHNRDYAGKSIYPSVAALREVTPTWSQGRLHVTLDLHCPWIRGQHNEAIYMVGSSDPEAWRQQQRFADILEVSQKGPLTYRASDNLPFGTAWNTGANYNGRKSCSMWSREIDSVRLGTSFEIPYANQHKQTITADAARAFGSDLARAVSLYLQSLDESP